MKYTIKGLTDATLTLNTLKITLRGNANKLKLYPNSIAKGVVVTTPEQYSELEALAKNKYIAVFAEETEEQTDPQLDRSKLKSSIYQPEETPDLSKSAVYDVINGLAKHSHLLTEDANNILTKALDLYEQGAISAKATIQLFTHSVNFVANKNKATSVTGSVTGPVTNPEAKTIVKQEVKPLKKTAKGAKKISRVEAGVVDGDDESATIMGPNGKAIKVSTKARQAPEDENKVQASLNAMAKMEREEEEAANRDDSYDILEEEKLDPSERMGNEVIISTGANAAKTKMTRSILPDTKPVWINAYGEKVEEADPSDEVSDAFVDKQEILERAELDEDKFIE